MKRLVLNIGITLLVVTTVAAQQSDYPITPVDFTRVKITDNFWRSRMETNEKVTIPHAIKKNREDGRVDNFIFAAGIKKGKWKGAFGFNDTDVYKTLEGMAFTYQLNRSEVLSKEMDSLIYYIGAAQLPDGYLYTAWNLRARNYNDAWCMYREKPYDFLQGSHEFYNSGHMYEAAVAHYLATGKKNFLDIALKNADHIYELFGPGKIEAIPGHQEIEIGLIKLYRITGSAKYLELAKLFLDRRGKGILKGQTGCQDHKPVIEQDEAVGHAVRANYMYTAMADVAVLTGDKDYIRAIDRLWENVVGKKMYLTGGMGAIYRGEAYGKDYELPNLAYAETCAAIAGVYWNHRMFLLHGDAKYMDVLERILYNGMISGVSLCGTKFFYPNPLHSDGKQTFNKGAAGRSEWFDCSCCPTNDVRFISSIPGYLYAIRGKEVYVNLYVSSQVDLQLGKNKVRIEQQTGYPWNGTIRTTVSPARSSEFTVNFRLPGWTQGKPVPSDLYTYMNNRVANPVVKVNGIAMDAPVNKGYIKISRKWKIGDVVELELPMDVKKVIAHENVENNRGRIALEYGPLVYCFEENDNGPVDRIILDSEAPFTVSFDSGLLGGVNVITANASVYTVDDIDISSARRTVKAIPYYAWNHRGNASMAVWIPYRIEKLIIR